MRILLATGIYPPESGGPATYTAGLASALTSRGHAVMVLAYGDVGAHCHAPWTVHRISRRGGPFVRYFRYAWRTFRLAGKSDVVYAQGPVSEGLPATIGAWFAARPIFMKVVGDYAWEMAMQKGNDELRMTNDEFRTPLLDEFLAKRHRGIIRFYEWAERWTCRRAHRVIVPSRYLKTVVERWGVPAARIEVVKNAVDPLPPTDGRDAERAAFGVADKTVILTAVRAVPWKGVAELVSWWRDVPTSHLLVVAGDGPELEKWKELAASNAVTDRIRFLGRADRQTLARWYAAADAFVLNSGYEGYPHVVAEAASVGLPCLVSDKGGNPETVEDFGEFVTVLPYDDKEKWVEALKNLSLRGASRTSDAAILPKEIAAHRPSDGLARNDRVVWTYDDMVDETENILAGTDGRSRTVMVGYERGLLDSRSDALRRVLTLVTPTCHVASVVIARCDRDMTMEEDGFRVIGFAGLSIRRLWKAIRTGIREARTLPSAAVVTAQDPFAAGLVGYAVSRWTNAPLEIQEHGDFYSGYWAKESWKNRVWSWIGRFTLRRAERVRAVSERVKDHLVRIGVDPAKIDVIPVAMDLAPLLEKPLRTRTDIPRILVPCRFVSQKGLDTLIEAASSLKARGLGFRLVLSGAGPLEAYLKTRIAKLGLEADVRIEGWSDPKTLWDDADLFVLSSRYEGFARTVAEAMAAGVPVIATDVGCVGSFLRPQMDGRVVQPDDPDALANAIAEQIREPERREWMRANARERAATFMSRNILHAKQRDGWQRLVAKLRITNDELRIPDPSYPLPATRYPLHPRFDLWIAAFLVFVILSRAASVILFHDSLLNREWGFFTLVDHWFKGYGYSFAEQLGCPSAYRSPGFLFFLTGLYLVFSPANTWAQAIVQNLVVVGVLWLVYAVGKRLVGKRAALVGGFLMAAYPYTFYHYTQYYHTFLSSFFLLLIIWFLLRLADAKRWRYAIGAGLSIGCLAYVQGTILPVTPFLVAWLLWRWWPNWKRMLKAAMLMALLSAGLIAPWTIRNWQAFHAFVPLTTDLGHALFKANNEIIYELTKRGYPQEIVDVETVSSTNQLYKQYRLPPDLEAELKRDGAFRDSVYWTEWHPREPAIGFTVCADQRPMNEVEFNRYWTARATDWLRANWATEGWKLQLLKLKTFWQPSLFPSVKTGAPWSFAGSPTKVWLARNAVTAASAVVIFGGWIGILFAIRRRNRKVWLPLAVLVVYTVLHTFFAGYTKYRIPLDNLMAAYAGWTIVRIWDAFRGRRPKDDEWHSVGTKQITDGFPPSRE